MIVNNLPRFRIILPPSTMFYFLLHCSEHCTCESARHIGHQSRSIIKHSTNQNWPDSAVKYRWQGSDFDVLYYTAVQKKAFQIKAVGFLKDRWTMDIYHSCTDWLMQQCAMFSHTENRLQEKKSIGIYLRKKLRRCHGKSSPLYDHHHRHLEKTKLNEALLVCGTLSSYRYFQIRAFSWNI